MQERKEKNANLNSRSYQHEDKIYYLLFIQISPKYSRSTLYIAIDKNIDMHCRFRSRFIVNQKFVFTFQFPFSLPVPGYCGLALTLDL